jgi:glycosyltransferase involved in cell wall biosynthesis
MRVSILVPVFQEEATAGELLARVARCDVKSIGFEREILVCDDGSTDRTLEIIHQAARDLPDIRVFVHSTNRGKGSAIRTLLDHATGDVVLVQDADLEYEVDDALIMLQRFRAGHDAVYGSRFLASAHPSGMRRANWLANRILTWTANRLYGHRLTDEATCLKLIRTSVLRQMHLECRRFDFCPEVTAKLGRLGIRIEEVPVRYHARDVDTGKKVRWTDGIVAMAVLLKYRWP